MNDRIHNKTYGLSQLYFNLKQQHAASSRALINILSTHHLICEHKPPSPADGGGYS